MVGTGLNDSKCIPYVSEYNDCSDANACSGCTRCGCSATGRWECQQVVLCPQDDGAGVVDDDVLENALEGLFEETESKKKGSPGSLVPSPPSSEEDLLLVPGKVDMEEELKVLMGRQKRSTGEDRNNATIKFYETVDEINEDTLGKTNATGTIKARKVTSIRDIEKISRRTDTLNHNNFSASDLHIEYIKPNELEHHIAENKIDAKHPFEDKINGLSHEDIHKILGNYSQTVKDTNLSKLVVNELKRGSERIGDKNVVPVSNITFTPENDTLTAMTFIAGNLLNKLWDMEKDANEGSYETEMMKHEKINDLLELFKEPLSLRQESFLKNALEKLSYIININKDIKNMSLCANIQELETITPDTQNCTNKPKIMEEQDSSIVDNKMDITRIQNKNGATDDAIIKINDVLSLMEKYEHLQRKLSDKKDLPQSLIQKPIIIGKQNVARNENISLNLFGKLLGKITNLLTPNKGKSISKRIRKHNMLRKDDIVKKNLEKIFNINLPDKRLGAKDKMITDYLSNIEKHPNCFFTNLKKSVVTPLSSIEGSILYNLSEFFKVKSLTDLLNIVNNESDNDMHYTTKLTTTTYPTKQGKRTVTELINHIKPINDTLESAKKKLKNDIKIILQDLFDLQKVNGIKTKNNINIADALPCIFKILNSDTDAFKDGLRNNIATSTNKLRSFIDALKADMRFVSPNRRSNMNILPRPKSAVVWERAIKNLDKKYKKASRRSLDKNLKSYIQLREMIDKVELSGNTYKSFAVESGVVPSERLILLKTLQADVNQHMNVLKAIEKWLITITNLASDKQHEIYEFVDNAAMNINLNKKLVALITKYNDKVLTTENIKSKEKTFPESNQPFMMIPKWVEANENNNFILKREQIMNQLIMNRLRLYIKSKERTEIDLNASANYNIAKRILFHLENGNIALAKELYKVFLANKQQSDESKKATGYYEKQAFQSNAKLETSQPKLLTLKEPLTKAEGAKIMKMLTQNYFLKQLWNLKELKE